MKSLTIGTQFTEAIEQTIGTFTFTEKKLRDLHSAVMKSLESAHTEGKELVLSPSEAAIFGTIMFDIERAAINL